MKNNLKYAIICDDCGKVFYASNKTDAIAKAKELATIYGAITVEDTTRNGIVFEIN